MTLDQQELRKVYKTLGALGDIEKDAVVAKGLREGATILVREGRHYIIKYNHIRKGNLLRSVAVKVRKKDGKAYAGFKRPEGSAAHLVSKGTQVRRTRLGANRGKVTGSNFWEQAVNAKGDEAMRTLMESVKASMERIIDRNR